MIAIALRSESKKAYFSSKGRKKKKKKKKMKLISIGESLYNNSRLAGDKLAVRCTETKRDVSHKELFIIATRVSTELTKAGVKRGDRIVVNDTNSIAHIVTYAASAIGGFVTVPINPLLSDDEQQTIIKMMNVVAVIGYSINNNISNPNIQIVGNDFIKLTNSQTTEAEKLIKKPDEPKSLDDDWVVLFTSGTTTGKSKGVARSQASSIGGFLTHTGPMSFSSSVVGLVAFPLHGISSFFFAFLYLYIGGSMVLYDLSKPDRSDLRDVIINNKVTYVTLSPAIITELLKLKGGCPDVKTVLLTGATSRPTLRSEVTEYFMNSQVFDVYGSTEAGMITMLLPQDMSSNPASVGFEPPGTSLCKIKSLDSSTELSDGEIGVIWVSTPMMFTRYILEEANQKYDALLQDGYFNQGDLGCRKDGKIYLTGRVDDMLVMSSGHCIYPAQLEAKITTIPEVNDCFILGIPSNSSPDRVICLAVAADSDRKEILEKISSFSIPQIDEVQFISPTCSLPRTPNGKVIKVSLRPLLE